MTARQLKAKYLEFFKEKKHAIIPSASLLPENDPTALFITAGMQPLIPYLMGESHPSGKRLANCQLCIRTNDIDEVGDNWHLTFFQMLGNWSLGDYFKEQSIKWSWEFLTSDKWLNIDPKKIHITYYEEDEETKKLWRKQGVSEKHLYKFGKEENWWGPVGATGPCGPDTEIFYDTGKEPCGPDCDPSCDCGKYSEIWNNVFMEFEKTKDGQFIPLKNKNVDTGMGLERVAAILQKKSNVFDTDQFEHIIEAIKNLTDQKEEKSFRIIADHLRAATFLLAEGITPSNVDQGYILRRLIRRAIRHGHTLKIEENFTKQIAEVVINEYSIEYSELDKNKDAILLELKKEEKKFRNTLNKGLSKLEQSISVRPEKISAQTAFDLYQSYGFPIEMTVEEAKKKGIKVDVEGFEAKLKEHQDKSRTASAGKFKGGLGDDSQMSKKYHTTTHLLHQALRQVLGDHVEQKGSNINAERLRFDFTHPDKLTDDQKQQVEDLVNQQIKKDLAINCEEKSLEEAKTEGALAFFGDKYAEKVKVYTVGDFSKEVCGGPHVESTSQLGHFKIKKEQSSSQGVRRIKAILE